MIVGEIRRLYLIIRVMFTYGLDECFPKKRITLVWRIGRKLLFWIPNKHPQRVLGERLRLALQELGPVWIKFAQMLSTRRDLLSLSISDQLAMLQNRVQPFDSALARAYIERSMGSPLETWFDDFQKEPLASASIAQVHTARLKKNGKEVVIKVIRPDILSVIKEDMRLMYRLAHWIPRFFPDSKRLRPVDVVLEYEKTLLNELNLLRETANALHLRRNFENSPLLYIPEIYPDYCSESMMVMERIYGVPVNDVEELKKRGTNMKLLAERGVQVFFIQVFRDSFFHGDMHPGNIFVSYEHPENPQYIGIDCGIVGSLSKEDKQYLAGNFIAFFNRDYRKIAELHVDSGWIPSGTNIEDFEFSIRMVCEPVFEKPLSEISFGHVLLNLFKTARRFNMEVQPQLILLQKTLLYIEGIGRQLYPQLNLWKTAKPFLEDWIKDHIGIASILRTIKERAPYWMDRLPDLPELLYKNLKQYHSMQDSLNRITIELNIQQSRHGQAKFLFGIGTTLLLGGIFLLTQNNDAALLSYFLIMIGVISWIIGWKRTIV